MTTSSNSEVSELIKLIVGSPHPETMSGTHLNAKSRAQLAYAFIDNIKRKAAAITEDEATDAAKCFICAEPLLSGQSVLMDVSEGLGHRACFGNDRSGFVKDIDTGEPLGPNDPLPEGWPHEPDASLSRRSANTPAGGVEVADPKYQAIHSPDATAVERLAYELAVELEQADLDRNDLVTANRAKLTAIAERILSSLHPADGEPVAWRDVLGERKRQIAKGFDADHDDAHARQEIIFDPLWGVLARLKKWETSVGRIPAFELVEVAAMALAELDRLYRAGARK